MKLSSEDKIILSSIKIHLNPAELEQLNGLIPMVLDWDYLIKTIIDRGIGPLLYKKLTLLSNSSLIPEPVRTKLQQAYYITFSRSTVLYEHFRKIAEAFTSQNIPVIALKGVYLSEWLYQDIGLRQFSDIDLLVKEEDALTCLVILEKMGYKSSFYFSESHLSQFILSQFETNKDIVHHTPRIFNGVSIEIHIKLFRSAEKYNLNISELWQQSIPATINGMKVNALSTYDLLIHLFLHLDKHFRGGKVQFTCFNDVTNLIERYADSIDWNVFAETCRHDNCEDIVFKYIILVNKYINVTVPTEVIQKYEALLTDKDEQFFCNILKGNINIHSKHSKVPLSAHFGYLGNVHSLTDKVRYLSGVIFPSKAFMIQRYKIKRSALVLFYYPYRYYMALSGVLNHLMK